MPRDRSCQRVDIDGIVMIGRNGAQRRLPAHLEQGFECLVVDGGCRCRGVLRIEREQEDAFASGLLQGFHARGDRRLAVAHAPIDDDVRLIGEGFRHQGRLVAGIGAQVALVQILVPDRLIGLADLAGAGVEHDAVEDRIPEQPRPFDDAAIAEELLEIAAHRGVVGAIGRAEIDQQNADLSGFNGRVIALGGRGGRVGHLGPRGHV